MRYQVKPRLFVIGRNGDIYDERGNIAYQGQGKFFGFRDEARLVDADGCQVAYLQSRMFVFPKSFHIEIGDRSIAKVVCKPFSFRLAFDIVLDTGEKWALRGSWGDNSFELVDCNGSIIAQIALGRVALADGYDIYIADGQDALLVLMIAGVLEIAAEQGGELDYESAF